MNKVKFLVILVSVLLITSLTACDNGLSQERKDNIVSDVEDYLVFMAPVELEVKDFQVIDKTTSKKERTEQLIVAFVAYNDQVECKCQYRMMYILIGNNWVLQDMRSVNRKEWVFTPLAGPRRSIVEDMIEEMGYGYQDAVFSSADVDLENLTATYVYHQHAQYEYVTEVTEIELLFRFDPDWASWYHDATNCELVQQDWDVDGTWSCYVESRWDFGFILSFQLNIDSFDGKTLEGDYIFQYITSQEENRLRETGPFRTNSEGELASFFYAIESDSRTGFGFTICKDRGVEAFVKSGLAGYMGLADYYECQRQ